MINISNFDQSLKICWIKKLLNEPKLQRQRLLLVTSKNIEELLKFGDQWHTKIITKVDNKFWRNVIKSWTFLKPRSCIWYNSQISKNIPFSQIGIKKGIHLVGDITKKQGKLLMVGELNSKFNTNKNILNYYTVKAKIEHFMSKNKTLKTLITERPTYPTNLDQLRGSKRGCKKFLQHT